MGLSKPDCTLILSYNDVDGLEPGSNGNGRVVFIKADYRDFENEKHKQGLSPFIGEGFNLISMNPVESYVYIGGFDSEEDLRFQMFQSLLGFAVRALNNDRTRIHLVGCRCGLERKKFFAEKEGFQFILSDCGGGGKLGEIARKTLASLPAEPRVQRKIVLNEQFAAPVFKKDSWVSFRRFASLGKFHQNILCAGANDGRIFLNRQDGQGWIFSGLTLNQGVNVIFPDAGSFLLGDGSCCSGGTWRLFPDGRFEQIFPVEGQGDEYHEKGNLNGNVFAFARRKLLNKLLCGVGGCSGAHIYIFNSCRGQWEYLPNDPARYVKAMVVSGEKEDVYILFAGEGGTVLSRYDGENFVNLGDADINACYLAEHEERFYFGGTDCGLLYPSNFSQGRLYCFDGLEVRKVWDDRGGIDGFFSFKGKFYAFGFDLVRETTIILSLGDNDSWTRVDELPGRWELFADNGQILAGGARKTDENVSVAVICSVSGL